MSESGLENRTPLFRDLDEIQEALHELYVAGNSAGDMRVRYLGTQGQPGARCLTLNLEVRADTFERLRDPLDRLSGRIRQTGFLVDELLQKVPDESGLGVRYWILIYETETHDSSNAAS